MSSFVDDYEFGAAVVRASAEVQGRPDLSALCAAHPDVVERLGAAVRPELEDFAETVMDLWRSLPWHVRVRFWLRRLLRTRHGGAA